MNGEMRYPVHARRLGVADVRDVVDVALSLLAVAPFLAGAVSHIISLHRAYSFPP